MNTRLPVFLMAALICTLGLARSGQAEPPKTLMVLEVTDKAGALPRGLRASLSDYLVVLMTEQGYKVLPLGQVNKRLAAHKKASYSPTRDEQFQISLGKELSAHFALSTSVLKVGSTCRVTGTLYSVERGSSERAAAVKAKCDQESLIGGFEALAAKLAGKQVAAQAPKVDKTPITKPSDACLTGKRCSFQRYLATHPYVLGGRHPDGRFAGGPRVTVGSCESHLARVSFEGRQVAAFTGPHQAGSKLKNLIREGRCFDTDDLPITTPFHRCLTGMTCAKHRYLEAHPFVLGGRFPNGKSAKSPKVTVGKCSAQYAKVFVDGKQDAAFTGPFQAGAHLRRLIEQGRCFGIKPIWD